MINGIQVSENFKLREFESPDTKQVMLDPELLWLLQALRTRIGKPVHVKSGYRTAQHNRAVKGARDSNHKEGKASDCYVIGMEPVDLANEAKAVGFIGIIVYHTKGYVHLDVREKPYIRGVM